MGIVRARSGQHLQMKRSGVVAALVCVVLLMFDGCSTPKVRFGYVATGQGIFAFRVDAHTGAASQVFGSPFVTKTNAAAAASNSSIILHPNGRFVYVANQDINSISRFTVDYATGALTEVLPRTPLVNSSGGVGLSPAFMTMDSGGNYLFVANQVTNDIWVFSIGSSGALTFVSSTQLGQTPAEITLSTSGNYLYVPVPSFSAIYVFNVSAGTLTQVGAPFVVSGGVQKIAVDPNNNFLYVPNPAIGTVTVLRIQSDGSLALGAGVYLAGTTPVAAATNPTGAFLYVANAGSANLSQFQVNATTGQLTPFTTSTVSTGTQPSTILVDHTAKFLFVVNQGANTVSEYTFNSDGTLATTGNTVQVNVLPRSFAITP